MIFFTSSFSSDGVSLLFLDLALSSATNGTLNGVVLEGGIRSTSRSGSVILIVNN